MSAYPVFRLGDVANIIAGDPAPQEPGAFAPDGPLFIRMQDVGLHHVNPVLADSADRLSADWLAGNRLRLFPKDSILIPKSGASVNLNHRAKLATDAHVVSHLAVIMPDKSRIDPDYLFWWSVRYDPRAQAQVTSLPSLKLSTLKEAKIALPPLVEQRRIASILNRAAKIERLQKQAQERLREFISALFIKMFGDPVENPMGWDMHPLGKFCTLTQYGTSTKANDRSEGVPVLRMGNVTYHGDLDCTNLKCVVLTQSEVEKYALRVGDILFNRTNSKELVGKTGIWDGRFKAVAASYFIRLRLDETCISPIYLWAFMNSAAIKHRLFTVARGAIGQANINAKEVKSLPLPVPPLSLQRQYADIVEVARAAQFTTGTSGKAFFELNNSLIIRLLEADG